MIAVMFSVLVVKNWRGCNPPNLQIRPNRSVPSPMDPANHAHALGVRVDQHDVWTGPACAKTHCYRANRNNPIVIDLGRQTPINEQKQ